MRSTTSSLAHQVSVPNHALSVNVSYIASEFKSLESVFYSFTAWTPMSHGEHDAGYRTDLCYCTSERVFR
jgi:hypothetical protein